ncbi:MAG: hypothetical protein WBD63_04585, partial [Phycisphaerae bacterium]
RARRFRRAGEPGIVPMARDFAVAGKSENSKKYFWGAGGFWGVFWGVPAAFLERQGRFGACSPPLRLWRTRENSQKAPF